MVCTKKYYVVIVITGFIGNLQAPLHPIYNIGLDRVKESLEYFMHLPVPQWSWYVIIWDKRLPDPNNYWIFDFIQSVTWETDKIVRLNDIKNAFWNSAYI